MTSGFHVTTTAVLLAKCNAGLFGCGNVNVVVVMGNVVVGGVVEGDELVVVVEEEVVGDIGIVVLESLICGESVVVVPLVVAGAVDVGDREVKWE